MNDLKRICFLLPTHFSSVMGGAEYQVKFVLDALCQNSAYDIHYLCRRADPDFIPRGYKIRNVGKTNGFRKIAIYLDSLNLYRVYRALQEVAPHIIYQNVGSAYTGIAAMYAKKFGAKMIWHIGSDNNLKPFQNPIFRRRLFDTFNRIFLNYGIRNTDIIAAQTKHQNDLLEKYFRRKCDVLIPIGHPFPTHEIKKSDKITVLWIGNLKPLKQPEIFVRLAKEVGRKINVSFVMMGLPQGPRKWLAKLLQEIDRTPKLEYLGGVSQDEVNRRLTEGHILVNTSQYEGFSNTFVQAWMRKVPVVSLTVDPDNILIDEKIGFRSGTSTKLCSDVERLIENKALRDEMGIRASSFAKKNHSVEKMVEKVIGLFY